MGNENTNQIAGVVHDYSYTNNYNYKLLKSELETEEEVPFYMGVELECECQHSNTQEELDTIANAFPCIMATDGSLTSRGAVEIISEAMSFKKWQEVEPNVKELLHYLSERDYKSHDTTTCGLHIHVTRPTNSLIIDRILFIMETYKNELVNFARRGGGYYNQWYSDYGIDRDDLKSLDFIKDHKVTNHRYMVLNLCNNKTIEFRFFKGTLNGQTYMACIELINNLVTLCSDLTRPVNKITWNLLTQGKNCKEYCKIRGISKSSTVPKDMTNEYIKMYNINKRKVSKIINILNNELIKQTSLFQLNIKTNAPSITASQKKDEFSENLTEYKDFINSEVRKLSNINATIDSFIQALNNNLNSCKKTEWLRRLTQTYTDGRSVLTTYTINKINEIVGGEE